MTVDELKAKLPKLPVVKIDFTGEEVGYKNSKLGGNYYWKDADGLKDYIFLAQINFSELPENDIFPKKGLLCSSLFLMMTATVYLMKPIRMDLR